MLNLTVFMPFFHHIGHVHGEIADAGKKDLWFSILVCKFISLKVCGKYICIAGT